MGSSKVERSIYEASLEAIRKAEHYIYIENQFFITNSSAESFSEDSTEEIKNKIGAALVQKVVEAHRWVTNYDLVEWNTLGQISKICPNI